MQMVKVDRVEFERMFGMKRGAYRTGTKQAVVLEFINSGYEVAEIQNPGMRPSVYRIGIQRAAKNLNVPVRCVIRGERVFLIQTEAFED